LFFVPNICNLTIRSQLVRNRWGVLMRSGEARKKFPNISVNNVITLSTRVRIQLLKVRLSVYFTSFLVVVYMLLFSDQILSNLPHLYVYDLLY